MQTIFFFFLWRIPVPRTTLFRNESSIGIERQKNAEIWRESADDGNVGRPPRRSIGGRAAHAGTPSGTDSTFPNDNFRADLGTTRCHSFLLPGENTFSRLSHSDRTCLLPGGRGWGVQEVHHASGTTVEFHTNTNEFNREIWEKKERRPTSKCYNIFF